MSDSLPDTTTQEPDYIRLIGGLDLHTPTLQLKPGFLRDTKNWEASINGGYARIKGYERYDGRPNPSDATYLALTLNVTGSLAVGDVMTGVTSAATGKVIYRNGALVVFTKSTGSFVVAETINVGGTPRATVTDLGGSETAADFQALMLNLAADEYRADILAVPGSGAITGVFSFMGSVYAFRNNAGGTAAAMYRNSAAGWVLVALNESVTFSNANTSVEDGDTLTQGATTATIARVVVVTGTLASGVNTGRLIITSRVNNFAAGAATSTGGGALTLGGIQTAITMLPSGAFEFDIGTVGSEKRVYGVDGVNPAFEFDGTTFVPILVAGNTPDTPRRVLAHSGHLFLSYGNSVQHSGIGDPYNWTVTAGGGELLADGDVTLMKRMPGSQATPAAAISNEDSTQMLYGSSGANFQLVSYEDSTGAKARSGQRLGGLGGLFVFDNQGVTNVVTTQNFGNFISNSLTLNVRSFLQIRRNLCTGSVVIKDKSQYRVFFSDGNGLYITMANGKLIGSMPVLFPNVVRCVSRGETPNGAETAFFGSDNGFVYRLEAGTSFDGAAIEWDLTTVYANQRRVRRDKRYRTATFELTGDSYASFNVIFDLDYGSTTRRQQQVVADVMAVALAGGVNWDEFTWDEFTWDGRALLPVSRKVKGSGENIAVRVFGSSDYFDQFTINSIVLTYSLRKRKL